MTIGAIVCIVMGFVILIGAIICASFYLRENSVGAGLIVGWVGGIVAIVFIGGAILYSNSETGKKALKDQQSEFGGGIHRIVTIYDLNGNVIKTYEGKFDIQAMSEDSVPYLKFDDENGKRHLIYYTTGTVIVDEK